MYSLEQALKAVHMKIYEVATARPPTPEQQRIKAMQAQVKRAQDAVKAERARQKISSGQKQLANVKTSNSI